MLVDIPDDLVDHVVSALRAPLTGRLATLADGIERRRADPSPTPEVTAETLTEESAREYLRQIAGDPIVTSRTVDNAASLFDHGFRYAHMLSPRAVSVARAAIARGINARAKDGRRG